MNQENQKVQMFPLWSIIIAIGLVISTAIVACTMVTIKNKENTIVVTGSAKKQIKSDFADWKGYFNCQNTDMTVAYKQLGSSLKKVNDYLKSNGVNEKDMTVSSITTTTNYKILPNGQNSADVDSYRLEQYVEVKSSDVDKITDISNKSTELINSGVVFQSNAPQYYYTKIADLKVDMLAEATKNAKVRAAKIAESTDGKVGSLRSASMGVFQITPQYSTDVSDSGINDTTSVKKDITAIVSCSFDIK